jgi:Ca2+-binding RTX toxin-like protein
LIGGPGDTLTGGKGADNFVFVGNFGQDTITNYNPNKDVIELDHNQFPNGLADVQHASQPGVDPHGGTDVVITVGANSITLDNVSLSQLHFDASHFLLV